MLTKRICPNGKYSGYENSGGFKFKARFLDEKQNS